jgi:magnesium transporter
VCAGELDLFVGHNYLVSAHKRPLPFADHLLTRARTSPELIALDADFMLYIILDEVLAYHEELERHMQGEIERMEERALRDTSDTFLEDLLRFKRYAFALYQLVDGHRPVFAAFLRPDFHWGSGEEIEEYVEDLHERLLRLLATLSQARDVVNGAFEIYVSQMSHRTNQVIKLLTIVSTVLFSASIIVSVFGITVATTIHRSPVGTPAGFLIMLICVLAVCGVTLYLFRRRGWI